jgi:predicted alpha/beta hydrolase
MRWVGAADLPRAAAREWARWGRHPMYTLGYEDRAGYEAFDRPLVHWSFPGDPYAPRTAVDALLRWYPAARIELRRPRPADFGRTTLGHFDFFRQDPGQAWWPELLTWLEAP